MTFFSFSIIPTANTQNLTGSSGIARVKQFMIKVTSMGDATVIYVGGAASQNNPLTSVNAYFSGDKPAGDSWVDISSLYIKSNGTTPTVVVIGDTYEGF